MRALISVSDKTGIVAFAKGLRALGIEIFSTGGTLKILKENKCNVESISTLTQFPEILGGRVKTLHPHVHGGILANRESGDHMDVCKEHHIKLIDLVIVDLYPFEATMEKKGVSEEDIIENIDIGGPTLLRAAAKNFQSVGVVVYPESYSMILSELNENKQLSLNVRRELATKAFKHVAKYDIAIANYFDQDKQDKTQDLPKILSPVLEKVTDLRYGENPHQKAALYTHSQNNESTGFEKLQGKELSYNNFLDIESAINIVSEFDIPGAVVIKHTNPCGAAISDTLIEAYKKAYDADPVSAFGSIVGLNRGVDKDIADELTKTFIEVIVAPDFDEEALSILSSKKNLRLIKVNLKDPANKVFYKQIQSGFLVQTKDDIHVNSMKLQYVTKKSPSKKEINDLLFAFTLVKYVKSNAILIVKDGQTIGIGAGQMSRIDSVKIALEKAGKKAENAVLASDALFPFDDSVKLSSEYGIGSIIQPGGSKRDQESIDSCDKLDMSMVFTGTRHFLH